MVCIFTHEKKECLRIDMRLNVPNPIVILHVLDSNLSNVSHEGVISKRLIVYLFVPNTYQRRFDAC